MILQALVKLYEDLAGRGRIALPGWGPAKISYALCIDAGGADGRRPAGRAQKSGGDEALSGPAAGPRAALLRTGAGAERGEAVCAFFPVGYLRRDDEEYPGSP